MKFLERFDSDRSRQNSPDDDPAGALDSIRQESRHLLDVGDAAINRALATGNSEAVLKAVQQQGGE
jgi:hypothetical protein